MTALTDRYAKDLPRGFLTPVEVTALLGISRPTLYRMVREDVLHPIRLRPSGHRRYPLAEIEALVEDARLNGGSE